MNYDFDYSVVLEYWPQFLHGAWLSIQLSISATVLGLVLGVCCAAVNNTHFPRARRWVNAYVEAIRNTPLLVQLFLTYFGLSSIGLHLSATVAAIITLTFNVAAYIAEIMRAGIESIHPGQVEAAECLGLSHLQTFWHVVLRPAMEQVYPALTSQFVLMMLATSITSLISTEELTAAANLVQSLTYRAFESYTVIAVIYLCLAQFMKGGFILLGLLLFPRRRKLGLTA